MSISRFFRSVTSSVERFFFEPERTSDWWSPPVANSQRLLRPTLGPSAIYGDRPRSQRHGSWRA